MQLDSVNILGLYHLLRRTGFVQRPRLQWQPFSRYALYDLLEFWH